MRRSHLVERIAQVRELMRALHLDAMAEVAVHDALRAFI